MKVKIECNNCKREYYRSPSYLKKGKLHFCSRNCYHKSRIGKKVKKETREKIRLSVKKVWSQEGYKKRVSSSIKDFWNSAEGDVMKKKVGINSREHLTGRRSANFKTGKTICKDGYIHVFLPNHPRKKHNYFAEHRYVVEKHIKRYLEPKEVIHHLDENKKNNKIENLMVFQTNSDHMRWHTKLRRYGYLTNPMKRTIENRWRDLEELDKKIGRKRNESR